jgi:carbon storage regulator CsrA
MLVLARKIGESISIGENIRIVIVGINNFQVKLGIDAPPDVEIYRKELFDRINGNVFHTKFNTNMKKKKKPKKIDKKLI